MSSTLSRCFGRNVSKVGANTRFTLLNGLSVTSSSNPTTLSTRPPVQTTHFCGRCMSSYTGSCHCGTVKFKCEGEPVAIVNCHCSVCRRVHSASYAPLVVFPPDKLTVTKGEKNLTKYVTGKEDRYFCKTCASKIYSSLNHLKTKAAFLQNFDGHGPDGKIRNNLRPQFHIFYGSGTVDAHDGLPKYDTLPAALGGSDKQLSEDFHSSR